MIISSIIEICLGLFICNVVPGWIRHGRSGARDFIKLCCNIIGIVITIAGALDLLRAFGIYLF